MATLKKTNIKPLNKQPRTTAPGVIGSKNKKALPKKGLFIGLGALLVAALVFIGFSLYQNLSANAGSSLAAADEKVAKTEALWKQSGNDCARLPAATAAKDNTAAAYVEAKADKKKVTNGREISNADAKVAAALTAKNTAKKEYTAISKSCAKLDKLKAAYDKAVLQQAKAKKATTAKQNKGWTNIGDAKATYKNEQTGGVIEISANITACKTLVAARESGTASSAEHWRATVKGKLTGITNTTKVSLSKQYWSLFDPASQLNMMTFKGPDNDKKKLSTGTSSQVNYEYSYGPNPNLDVDATITAPTVYIGLRIFRDLPSGYKIVDGATYAEGKVLKYC